MTRQAFEGWNLEYAKQYWAGQSPNPRFQVPDGGHMPPSTSAGHKTAGIEFIGYRAQRR